MISVVIQAATATHKESTQSIQSSTQLRYQSPTPALSPPLSSLRSVSTIVIPPHTTQRTQATPICIQQHIGRGILAVKVPEPRIPFDPGRLITPPARIAQKILHQRRGVITAIHAKLRDPDGIPPATRDIIRLRDVVLEVLDVIWAGVPVQVQKVDGEVHLGGVAEELGQVGEPVLAGVGHGDGADLDALAGRGARAVRERLHVGSVALQGLVQRHARRQPGEAGVRLVETEQRVRAVVRERELHVRRPDGRQGRVVVEE